MYHFSRSIYRELAPMPSSRIDRTVMARAEP